DIVDGAIPSSFPTVLGRVHRHPEGFRHLRALLPLVPQGGGNGGGGAVAARNMLPRLVVGQDAPGGYVRDLPCLCVYVAVGGHVVCQGFAVGHFQASAVSHAARIFASWRLIRNSPPSCQNL